MLNLGVRYIAQKRISHLLISFVDDETDMAALEASVRSIEKDGLVWGASKLVPVGFGIKKLQINLVIEDDKIGLDDLQEQIQGFEDYVQSTDIVSSAHCYVCNHEANNSIGCYAEAIEHNQLLVIVRLPCRLHDLTSHSLLAFPATGSYGNKKKFHDMTILYVAIDTESKKKFVV